MAKVYTAKRAGEILGLPHLEVIRRIRKGQIRASKFGWNWTVSEEAIEEVKMTSWYQRYTAKHQAAS
jgi:hypothetical protein